MARSFMKTTSRAPLPFRQLGASLLEVLGAISISTVILTGIAQQTNTYIDNTKDAYTAEHAKAYAQAAQAYVKENKSTITTNAQRVEVEDLQKYLPVGFSSVNKNPYGQTPVLVAKKNPDTQNIEGFLVYEVDGGGAAIKNNQIPEGRRQFVAALAGLGGGYVDKRNEPKGAGWDASDSYSAFRGLAAAKPGMMVMSLNLFEPADVLDSRYVCRSGGSPGCNQMELDLQFAAGKGIVNASYLNTSGPFSLSATSFTVKGDATFNNAVNFNSGVKVANSLEVAESVTVGGTVTADTVRATKTVLAGEACSAAERGAIARKARASAGDNGTGVLMTCRKSLDGNTWSWLPVFSAQEERTNIIGCWGGNDFCKKTPKQVCWERQDEDNKGDVPEGADPICDFDWKKVTRSKLGRLDSAGNEQWAWESEIGERMFCALGFHSQTGPKAIVKEVSGTKFFEYPGVTGGADHTFCRVNPRTVKVNGVDTTKWYIKVGSAYQTPIGCHAVCVSEE